MAASKGGKAKKGARRARKAAPKPGARAGKGGAGTNKGAAAAGGAVKPDAARVRAWRLRGRQGVYRDEHNKRWQAYIHYGEQLHLGSFKTEEDAIALLFLAEDRIAAGCHPKTGKYVPEAERPKPPKTQLKNNAHLLGKPAQKFSDEVLGEHATDFAAKVDAGTLDIDQVAGVSLENKSGKWRAQMNYKKKKHFLGSYTSDLAEAIRYRLLAEKAIALFPDKNPKDYVAARMAAAGAAGGAGKKRKRSTTVNEEEAEESASTEETAPPLRRRRTLSTNEAPAKTPPTTGADDDDDACGDDDHNAYAAGDDDEADTDADDDDEELRRQLAGQRNVMVLALREALGRSGRDAEAHRREAEGHRREAEAQRQEIEAHRRDAEAQRLKIKAQRRQTERLRREVARLQAEDGHCARSRPYYWQR